MSASTTVPVPRQSLEQPAVGRLFRGQFPLSNFESYMLVEDSERHPMAFFIELQLSGELFRGPFESALREALQLHPLLTRTVERSRWGRSKWSANPTAPELTWHSSAGNDELETPAAVNLAHEPGLRIWVVEGDVESSVIIRFHHAATDGIGAIQFIGDWLARFGRRTAGPEQDRPKPAPVAVERLEQREVFFPDSRLRRGLIFESVRCTWELFRTMPRRLASGEIRQDQQSLHSRGGHPRFYRARIDGSNLRTLKRAARTRGVTLNDLALLAMFRTVSWWNETRGERGRRPWLRVAVPFNLRTPLHDDLPAANSLSFLLLNRRQDELREQDAALGDLHRRVESASGSVQGRLFTYWVGGLASRFPWLYRLLSRHGTFCSAVLANVGDVRRQLRSEFPLRRGKCVVGSVILESLCGAAPCRDGTPVALSFGTYAGELYLNLSTDAEVFAPQESQAFLDRFVGELTAFAVGEQSQQALQRLPATDS